MNIIYIVMSPAVVNAILHISWAYNHVYIYPKEQRLIHFYAYQQVETTSMGYKSTKYLV